MNSSDACSSTPSTSTALVVVTPEVAGRLIGLAVAQLPQVQARTKTGRMVIVGGATTRHVARCLTGEDPGRDAFTVGWIRDGALGETEREQRGPGPVLFEEGVISRGWPGPLLEKFGHQDIYIKGANALDPQGNCAILMASPTGGTIAAFMNILHIRGGELIIPVSLRKHIPSVPAVCGLLGQEHIDRVMGTKVGYMPIMAGCATLVTEITAFKQLSAVQASLVAAGGVDDCAAAQVFHLAGTTEQVDHAWNLLQNLYCECLQSDN